ncbi:histone acetyltransferase HAC1-like [Lycium ferocissimum]|uniref:histone acetyltransferase HAC1-like n=1 Tax=Lycium ferocissimum TaxID=112874 RepID=UPI0028162326|nr:histone acetyltransferase HAC1-like [Lycium ferocissimum]
MLDLLVHASSCRVSHCQYPNCRQVKGLFLHGMKCKIRAAGGCDLCKKVHARTCEESECHVPRCRELKETKQMIMRQHGAEVASGSG